MYRLRLYAPLFLIVVLVCAGCQVAEETEEELVERARGVHERIITLDTHDDINTSNFTEERNYTMDLPTQVTLPKMREGGLDVGWFIVYTGQEIWMMPVSTRLMRMRSPNSMPFTGWRTKKPQMKLSLRIRRTTFVAL